MSTRAKVPSSSSGKLGRKLGALYLLVAAVAAACIFYKPAATVSESGIIMRWPDKVLGFTGKDEPVGESERVLLPSDTEFAKKNYVDAAGDRILTQTVLSGVERRSIHRPEICLKGQGWAVQGGQIVPITLKSGHVLDVMMLDITRPFTRPDGKIVEMGAIYAYFFVSKDAQTPRHLDRIAITNMDLLFHNKAHRWAYVIAMAQITKGFLPNGKDRQETIDLVTSFLREAAPDFLKSEISATATTSTQPAKNPATPAGGI